MKWGELFASNVFTVADGTAYLQDWLRQAFAANMPYDRFVKEILTATGSSWHNGAVNFGPPRGGFGNTNRAGFSRRGG